MEVDLNKLPSVNIRGKIWKIDITNKKLICEDGKIRKLETLEELEYFRQIYNDTRK